MIHAYWLKKLTSLHKRLACHMEKLVTEGDHPSWLTQGRTVLVMKDPQQGPISSNYRPITCLRSSSDIVTGCCWITDVCGQLSVQLSTLPYQSVEQPDPPKKGTEMFWKGIWKKNASHNDKAKWIAELKADHKHQ